MFIRFKNDDELNSSYFLCTFKIFCDHHLVVLITATSCLLLVQIIWMLLSNKNTQANEDIELESVNSESVNSLL